MVQVAINLYRMSSWFDGDLPSVVDLVRCADDVGIDQVNLGDHVALGEDLSDYPTGKFADAPDSVWYEPITLLAGIATATRRICLSTGILISPLRPAVFLAKQLSTLDQLSRGRVQVGVGKGWHKAEFDACNVPFASRLDVMEEQIRACQSLWRTKPASFKGSHVSFENLYSVPQPVQAQGIPILIGGPPTARILSLIAEIGNGWLPLGLDVERFSGGMQRLTLACKERGRDPNDLLVRHLLMPLQDEGGEFSLEKSLIAAQVWLDAGATMIEVFPAMFCRGPEDFEPFLHQLSAFRNEIS